MTEPSEGGVAVFADARSDIAQTRARSVFAWLDELVDGLNVPASHRALLRVHLGVGREQIEGPASITATQLPLLVHAALAGNEAAAMPLAGACTLLYLGADLLDNIADDEVTRAWDGRSAAEMQLAASTYLAPLYQIALAQLCQSARATDAQLWALSALFRDALLEMSAGQHDDLRQSVNGEASPEASRLMVERKSGAEIALFAQAAAMVATDDNKIATHFAEFGRCFGAASQLVSDVADIWGHATSRDLANGKRTLPIAHALAKCGDAEREHLMALLTSCRTETPAHEGVRRALIRLGSLRYTALVIEIYRQRGLRHLECGLAAARGSEDAIAELRAMLEALALFPAAPAVPLRDVADHNQQPW